MFRGYTVFSVSKDLQFSSVLFSVSCFVSLLLLFLSQAVKENARAKAKNNDNILFSCLPPWKIKNPSQNRERHHKFIYPVKNAIRYPDLASSS